MDFGGAGLKLFKSIPPLALYFPAPCGTRLTEVPFPPPSPDKAILEWPARQLCFPTNLFSRISGFASHLYRWFAFSNNFYFQQSYPLPLNESDLPAMQNIGAGDGQVVLNARIEQKECQDVSGTLQERIRWKKF